jgi:hypothetical protein
MASFTQIEKLAVLRHRLSERECCQEGGHRTAGAIPDAKNRNLRCEDEDSKTCPGEQNS